MEKTVVMIKPDGIHKKAVGEIIKRVENEDLNIVRKKNSQITERASF